MVKQVFLSPDGEQWKVKTVGAQKPAALYKNKAEALIRAIKLAKNQNAELVVQKQDGMIQYHNSYGRDPFPPRG